MKKLFTTLVLFVVAFSPLFAQTATAPSVGDGSENAPYHISSLENLYWLSQNPTHWDKYYLQTANIDASETQIWDNGAGWQPVGNNDT